MKEKKEKKTKKVEKMKKKQKIRSTKPVFYLPYFPPRSRDEAKIRTGYVCEQMGK